MITHFLSPWKTLLLIAILSSPQEKENNGTRKHPFSAIEVATRMMSAANAVEDIDRSIHRPGPSLKEWRLNTNIDNVANWQGLKGHENCTKNIYEFPAWYDDQFVVTMPSEFIAKQIILPVNGHFVFREGVTTFSSFESGESEDTCRGREVKFLRTKRADWFDPDNWVHQNSVKISSDGNSLLNEGGSGSRNDNDIFSSSKYQPIPHVERVPCQYDSVRFPANSSFNLKISSDVTVANFFLGNEKYSHSNLTALMNSSLGKLQIKKDPATVFSILSDSTNASTSNPTTASPSTNCFGSNDEITDSDRCICTNYINREMKQKICALADCSGGDDEDECPNPITPHGFCCPICGFHIRIRHSGNLRLVPLHSKLKGEITGANLQGKVLVHLSRYKERSAHIVILSASGFPQNAAQNGDNILLQIGKLVLRIESILNREESEVIGVTLTESWGELLPSGESTNTRGSSDRLEGSGLGGGLITLIVLLLLVALLAGIALFIFIWNKKHGYPPLTLSSVTSVFPRMPSMRIPIVPGGGGGRRSSTLSNSLHSFGFARFTNERVSSVTIGRAEEDGQGEAGEAGGSTGEGGKTTGKSSTIRRTEQVDDEVSPVAVEGEEKVTDVNSGAFGFSNVTYDLVAGVDGGEEQVKVPQKPLLTIPEVTVVDMDEETRGGSTSGDMMVPMSSSTSSAKSTASTNNGNKEESGSKNGKFSKPSFIASRMASAYKKLGSEVDDQKSNEGGKESSSGSGESSRKGKKKVRGGDPEGNTNRPKGDEKEKSEPIVAAATSRDNDQQSTQVERNEDHGIFQEFISVAEDTLAAAATATSAHVEEAKIIDFEE